MSEHYTIGIDISKGRLECHALPGNNKATFDNSPTGITRLLRWAHDFSPDCIAFEATGRYHRQLELALHRGGLPAHRCNPSKAAMFGRVMQDRSAKTDTLDAFRLASYAAMHKLQPDTARDPQQIELSDLLARREALVRDLTCERNRQQDATTSLLKTQNRQRLKMLARHIQELEQACENLIATCPRLARRRQILLSIPGIGQTTMLALLAWLPELGEMNAKQAGSLAGVAPKTRESGTWKGRSMISGGRRQLGTKLYMAALTAARHNPPLKANYVALKANGKAAKLALVAIMRKLVVLANTLLKQDREWTPQPPKQTP